MKRFKWLGILLALGLLATACGRSGSETGTSNNSGNNSSATTANAACQGVQLQATEVGVTADTITIQVMADVGSPLAPGLFQGNLDALNGYAKFINANGGIACRQLKVETWDSKLDPTEAKNGLINACTTALAMVGNNALFNPDMSPANNCVDKAGQPTGLPDIAALANDINEQCAPTAYMIQGVAEKCPPAQGVRPLTAFIGNIKYYQSVEPNLHGIYLVPGDLPTTVQSATYQIQAQKDAGVTWDGIFKVSGRDEQSAYTPRVQVIKQNNSNYVYNGSNDKAMINMRKEAEAQGVNSVKVWACSIACYTQAFTQQGGTSVEGTYSWLQFLPFEEASSNQADQNYVDNVQTPDSFGAQAWQAAMLFKSTIDKIVQQDGPNGITRAKMLDVLNNTTDFTADGWMGSVGKNLKGFSPCFVVLQVKNGKWERAFPSEKGTLNCDQSNLTTVTLDPAAEAAKIQ